jgi:DNA-binding PadR family transcriptional regulator
MQADDINEPPNWLKEMRRGYLRIAVLTLLSKKPRHGYEIMKEIKERSGGFWRPTAGGIYPILQSLEESGYIEGRWGSGQSRKRKTYRITETGRPVLEQALVRQDQIASNMGDLFKEFMKDVLDVKTAASPRVPNFFLPFMEEKPGDDMAMLERKRGHIKHAIEHLQDELSNIDKRLAKMETQQSKTRLRSHQTMKTS